jgi:hypothetical protein
MTIEKGRIKRGGPVDHAHFHPLIFPTNTASNLHRVVIAAAAAGIKTVEEERVTTTITVLVVG